MEDVEAPNTSSDNLISVEVNEFLSQRQPCTDRHSDPLQL